MCLQVRSWKRLNSFIYFFTYLFSLARGGKYSPIRIHQKVFNDLYYFHKVETVFREKLETVNKSISKKVDVLVMFLYLRNGQYVSNFIYWMFLLDGNYSNNNIFLFYNFFHKLLGL